MMSFIIIFSIILILLLVIRYLFPFVQIVGDSMFPTYFHDEIVFGTRLYSKSKLKIGDVIVYKTSDRIVVKRIAEIESQGNILLFYCLGDNADVSYDSRHYGYISSEQLICKIRNPRPNRRKGGSNNG